MVVRSLGLIAAYKNNLPQHNQIYTPPSTVTVLQAASQLKPICMMSANYRGLYFLNFNNNVKVKKPTVPTATKRAVGTPFYY
jgi:hypothetical protein